MLNTPKLATIALLLAACGGNAADQVDAPVGPTPDSSTQIDGAVADGPATGTDPADDGAFTVVTTTASIPGSASGRTLPATVFAPSTGTNRALVIVSPGFQMTRTQYTSYATHLATWGFVVVLTDYADTGFFANHQLLANDVTSVIDWALPQSSLAIDPQRVATVGHSLGGKISVFAAAQDVRIKAVVAWDPVDSSNPSVVPEKMTGLGAAIAVVGETTNGSGG